MYESRIDLSEGIRPLEARAGESHLRLIASALGTLRKRARAAIEEAERIGDADTARRLHRDFACHEQLWLIEAHLDGPQSGARG